MNILMVNKMYSPEIGGVETVIKQYAEWMANDQHDVTVLTVNKSPFKRTKQEIINGVKIIRCSSIAFLGSMPISFTVLFNYVRISKKFDIIHFHEPYPLGSLMGLFTNRRKGIVVTWHSDIIKQSGLLSNIVKVMQNKVLTKASVVTTTSNRLLLSSPQLLNVEDKVMTLPLSTTIQDKMQITYNGYFLFLGRIAYYKGIDVLVDALERSKLNRQVLIVGTGDRVLEERIQSIANMRSNVRFINKHVNESEKAKFLSNCYCLLFPSTHNSEAFGIIQIEAMSHGKPVINTALITGVSWVSQEGLTGFTAKPRCSDSFLSKMELMDSLSFDDYKRFCENSRQRVQLNFEDKIIKRKLLKTYKECIN
jgi:glycosyltransferase involved in cell wall biosynthesis